MSPPLICEFGTRMGIRKVAIGELHGRKNVKYSIPDWLFLLSK